MTQKSSAPSTKKKRRPNCVYQPTTSVFIIIRVCFGLLFSCIHVTFIDPINSTTTKEETKVKRKKTLESKPSSTFIRWSASQFHFNGTIFINFSWFFRIASDRQFACVKCCKSELFYLVDMHFICLLEYFFVIFCYETHIHTHTKCRTAPPTRAPSHGMRRICPVSNQFAAYAVLF